MQNRHIIRLKFIIGKQKGNSQIAGFDVRIDFEFALFDMLVDLRSHVIVGRISDDDKALLFIDMILASADMGQRVDIECLNRWKNLGDFSDGKRIYVISDILIIGQELLQFKKSAVAT